MCGGQQPAVGYKSSSFGGEEGKKESLSRSGGGRRKVGLFRKELSVAERMSLSE